MTADDATALIAKLREWYRRLLTQTAVSGLEIGAAAIVMDEAADALAAAQRQIAEWAETRQILAGGDHGSLPNDWTLPQIAEARMDDIHKLTWQVRDTCKRAEAAEAERDTWRNECLLTAAHQGIDNYQRMIDRATKAESEVAALREQVQALTAVPREPTDRMLHVGLDIWQRTYPGFDIDRLGDIWSAMYDAARQPRAEDNNESTPWGNG